MSDHMTAYKFLESIHINHLLIDGTVKVRSLEHYRQLEGKQWISDRKEGLIEVNIAETTLDVTSRFAPKGFPEIFSGQGTILKNVTLAYQHPDVFIFSASHGDLSILKKIMRNDDAVNGHYNACVRIPSIELLAHRIFHRGILVDWQNRKVRDVFSVFRCARVEYTNLSRDQFSPLPPAPSPFLKDLAFSPQSEVRIVLYPKTQIALKTFTIKIPRPNEVFSKEF